jgi:hypothetical protein
VTVYPNSATRTLSRSHQRQLTESDIAPQVSSARGYRTIRHRSDVPDEFADWQRRLGLLVPIHSPDGQTKGHQLKPNKPIRRKDGSAPKYETPTGSTITLDVNPLMLEEVRCGDGDLWITEGSKKVDSLASRGEPAVGFIGVWNMAAPGTKGTVPLACWQHVRLKGRRVIIVFDADARTNPGVQEALRRAVVMLESLGAVVLVVYLPAVNGDDKTGVDDYFAGGGTVAELRIMAGPYKPVDVGAERMSRDEKLGASVRYLWRRWREGDWMGFVGAGEAGNWQRGHTARDTMEALIELAAEGGKVDGCGVVVGVGLRRLSRLAAKSAPSVGDAVKHLEAEGQLEILPPEDRSKARSYRLLVPSAALYSMERGRTEGTELEERDPRCKGLRYPSAPRLRWSSPAALGRLVRSVEGATGRAVTEAVGENIFVPSDYRPYGKRLGPHRGAILDALEASGGEMHLKDLCEVLHRKRPWDVRRRILKPLEEAGIIEMEGDVIRLGGEWLERLDERREADGEIEQAERQATKHRRQGESYRLYLERQKRGTPKASTDAVKRSHDLRVRRIREAREEEERRRSPVPPALKERIAYLVGQNSRLRMGLLRGIVAEEGYHFVHVSRAVEELGLHVERLAEFDNEPFVFAPAEGAA